MRNRIALTFFAIGLVLFIAVPVVAQNAKVYFSQGGSALTVGDGGTLTVASGGTLTLAGGSTFSPLSSLVGANSDSFSVGSTNNTLLLTVDSTNTAVFMGADAAGAANTTLDTTGAGAITIGSADVTAVTITTDNTGDGSDLVLPAQSVQAAEILNDTITPDQLSDTLTLDANTTISGSNDFVATTVAPITGPGAEAGTGVAATERCMGNICQTLFTLTSVSVTITDPGGAAAYGSLKIYDFPEGYLYRIGLVGDLTATAGAGGIADDWDGDIAFGSAADAGGGLAGTEVNFVAATSTTQAVAGIGAADCASTVTEQTILDGHSTAVDLYMTFNVDDADISAGDTLAVSGSLWLTWVKLGDN